MHSNNFLTLIVFNLLILISFHANSAVLFEDSFETGDYSKTNSDGFLWTDNSWTSIVTATEEVAGVAGVPLTKANAASFPGGDWTPHDGLYSMRFRFAAGQDISEQRFDLGTAKSDIWISYWMRVPTNFSHSNVNPSNRKWFAIWMDGYSNSGNGPTVAWEFWSNGSSGSDLAFHYSEGGYTVMGSHLQMSPFISYPLDQGRWMKVVLHLQAATNSTSNDGVIQMWRKWDGDSTYTKLHDIQTANIAAPVGGPAGWKAGYIMGWVNRTYDVNTEWLIDDFILSETPLLVAPKKVETLLLK